MPTKQNDNLTDAEIDGVVASVLTEEDIRQRSQALSDAQDRWEKVAYLSVEKIPCRECGGTGRVAAGSFGDLCLGCEGTRVESSPDAEEFQYPVDFAAMRRAIGAYGDALIDRALPDGHRAKKNLALPPPESVPTLEALQELDVSAKAKAKELKQLGVGSGGRGTDPRQLAEGGAATGFEGDGDLGDVGDDELDKIEDAVIESETKSTGARRKR